MMLPKKYINHTIMGVLIACMIIPFLLLAFFTFPLGDDLLNALTDRQNYAIGGTLLVVSETVITEIFRSYAALAPRVLFSLISPLEHFGLTGMRITIFSINLMFLVSMFVFIRWLFKGLFADSNSLHWMGAYFLFTICFVGFRFQAEAFTWMTCSIGYILPLNCLFLGLTFYIKGVLQKRKCYWVLSALLGVFGAWGVTHISVLICGLYAAALILLRINQKGSRPAILVTLIVVAAGVLILFAPGIHIRHSYVSEEYYWFPALEMSAAYVWRETLALLRTPVVLVLCLFAVLAFKWFAFPKPIHPMNVALAISVAILGPIMTLFPYYLGYGGYYINLDYTPAPVLRVVLVADIIIIMGLLGVILSIVAFVKSRTGDTPVSVLPLAIILTLFCGSIASSYSLETFLPLKVTYDIVEGKFGRCYRVWAKTFEEWEQSKGQDVEIAWDEQWGYRLPYFLHNEPSEDPTFHVNREIAGFYELRSLTSVQYRDATK